ncbi:nitric oxide dioxygenase [Coniosporium apollinis CBS 100218]|uniref:nitric oxide dioxygenase n=1 Tax=Coniosporium apollinis (strain CBS 100218) TaxID=1168221 RepID=R7YY07_CONA1|nr:nitric oxide dioxygenase [Coniosporium apollinis CBS 100218]EON66830.1 nitric oxide dioxygenase [Coniosporium apollinis CBS 100218]
MSLTPSQAATIKATVPVLSEHGNTITKVFYKNMLTAHPELNDIFNTANQINGHQPRALAGSLFAYADNIDDLGKLSPAVELICNKHASQYVRPEHYKIVGTYLLAAMHEVLGSAHTSEIHDAWAAAYWQLANLMTQREEQLYKAADGWTNWRDLRIARIIPESAEITSFYFEPVDGKPLPGFLPGQYISVQMDVPALRHRQVRQYSLSDAPWPDYYRISVKREKGLDIHDPEATGHPGYVSNVLHDAKKVGDVIEVSHAFGDFFLDPEEKTDAPVVLLSAGVGLTCLLSILNTLVARKSERPIVWIHAAKDTKSRAFEKHVTNVVRARDNVRAVFFTKNVGEEEVQGKHYDFQGRMDLDKLDKERDLFVANRETRYFLCGPTSFMLDIQAKLESFGVDESRLKLELYGTGDVPKC